jgi:hypothetical protein
MMCLTNGDGMSNALSFLEEARAAMGLRKAVLRCLLHASAIRAPTYYPFQ